MVEAILGLSWIYLMYRVGALHAHIRDVVTAACDNADADPPSAQTQISAEE
jgi:hypothetical protein